MAYYAALTSLLQTLEQIPQPPGHEQITSLYHKASSLLIILRVFPEKRGLMIEDLEWKIRDTSYEAEDIIQSNISRKSTISRGASSCFWEMISAIQNMIPARHICESWLVDSTHRNVALEFQRLKQIIDEFQSILDDLSNKIYDWDLQPRNPSSAGSSRFPASNESHPVGIDEDLLRLKGELTGSASRLGVIPIVGMGGIGKTTLARNLYNDSLIVERFHIRAWIVISQEYHERDMLVSLLASITFQGHKLYQMSIEQLADLVYKSLKGRRYLIVMDNLWSTRVWDDVKRLFPDDLNGSRIMLTTRIASIAIYAGRLSNIHQMRLLSPEASWVMLQEKVFGDERCPSALEDIGKKIAKNCKGLPLTIVAIGGLLKGIKTQEWEYIAENVNSAVSEKDDQFMDILSLSYNSLPDHLKPCFLYMGVFPEDYEIFVSQLFKLWIAEGFIKPQAHKSVEEVAEDYLKVLIDRSLIMVLKKKPNGEIKTCIVHDMFREMCKKTAQDEKFVQIINWEVRSFPQGRNYHRRVSIHSNIVDCLTEIDESYVHSFLCFCAPRSELLSFTMSSRLLRVFDALAIRFYEFPIEIVELVHLRYLAFLYRGNSFPASISKLQNLQTLIVLTRQPIHLPPHILEMPQLRHLLFEESFLPAQIIQKNLAVLENLQTLTGITNFKYTRNVLEMMPNLKKLGISYVHDTDTEWSHYEFHNLVCLGRLETLKCLFIPKLSRADHRPLPLNLAFPPNLRKLTLSGCRISWEAMTVIGSLLNLEVLKLKDHAFEGPIWQPMEGEFSNLKYLLIDMSFLKHWIVESAHFPRLQHLSLSCCPKLEEIPADFGDIPTLEMIELYECSSSVVYSAELIQKEQKLCGNESFRVRVNFYSDYYSSQQQTSLRKVHKVSSVW